MNAEKADAYESASAFLLDRKLRRISYQAKKRSAWIALRRNRNLSLRDPPQAENPAEQNSIFIGFYLKLKEVLSVEKTKMEKRKEMILAFPV